MDIAEMLARTELLAGLGEEALGELAGESRVAALSRGDLLFSEGDPADALYVVVYGRIAIARRSGDGHSSLVALMEEEDVFGEMPLLDGGGRSAEARSLEVSEVIAVPYGPLRRAFEVRPEALWQVVSLLARRLRTTNEALADSMFLDVTGRTAKRLLELSGESDDFFLPVTQEELAGLVGASRERVNKAIATFCRLGWLAQEDRRYRVLDRTKLAQRAT